ncbi:tetratricopeptide repeat protein, partial [Limnohabitans planktonicus]|uniref:tetratricopeptide repeat protein n=1 Tax=Limnohabitans planktonicus TaxID=540060 RepID=UPI00197C25FB
DDLGRANALQALGDLDRRLGQIASARGLYTQAIALYEKNKTIWAAPTRSGLWAIWTAAWAKSIRRGAFTPKPSPCTKKNKTIWAAPTRSRL